MRRGPDRKTFADVVREVREQPSAGEPDVDGVTDPEGNRWHLSVTSISGEQAHLLAAGGARVAWDPCGCGGFCGFTWFTSAETARLVAAGTPRVHRTRKRHGHLSEWRSSDGRVLVVAEDAVSWADLLA